MQNTHDLLVGTLSIGIPSLLLKNSQLTPPFWYVFYVSKPPQDFVNISPARKFKSQLISWRHLSGMFLCQQTTTKDFVKSGAETTDAY